MIARDEIEVLLIGRTASEGADAVAARLATTEAATDAEIARLREREATLVTERDGAVDIAVAITAERNTALAQLGASAALVDGLGCNDRDDDTGRDRCDQRAVAIPWGTLFRKEQVGPKCVEHLHLRHPEVGALIPGPVVGGSAIVYLDGLHRILADSAGAIAKHEQEARAGALRDAASAILLTPIDPSTWLLARADALTDGQA